MNFTDSLKGKGNVTLKLFRKSDDKLVEKIDDHNLIVKMGRSEIIKLLTKKSAKGITTIGIGSGGADLKNSPFTPIPPSAGDTSLGNKVSSIPISTTTVDTDGTNPKATFTALFDSAEVNSKVNELGLFFDDGVTLFSKITFKTISLESDSGFYLQVTWRIEIQ